MSCYPMVHGAHRGASAECPENTLLAFSRAIAHGVDALELDVHLTRDDVLLVIHDSTLERTTNGTGRVRDHSLTEIRQLDAGQGQRAPTLDKGTTVIHRHDQAPHMNLELFSQAPLIGEAEYRAIGCNAARHALGQSPDPVIIPYRGQALGARFHVQTALLYAIETSMIEAGRNPETLEVEFHDGRRANR